MPRPRFTLVSAVYGVAAYLPEFIASVEAQEFPLERVEVVMVDDGSTDGSLQLLQEWQRRRPELVTVITQPNAGQGAARNAGTAAAHGEWITFPDPDDVLDTGYLSAVDAFLTAHPETDMVAANRWIWQESTGKVTDSHPLRHMFLTDQLVDLDHDGTHFQGSAPAAFFQLDRVRDEELRFDERVRPTFEDGHFCCHYLLGIDRPHAGFLASARYHYRKRLSLDSTLQRSRSDVGRYTDVLTHGYLDVLHHAMARHGRVPPWLQAHLVYDLSWYFTLTDSQAPAGTPVEGPAAELMHDVMREILGHVDVDTMVPNALVPLQRVSRYALQYGYRDDPWHEPFVALDHLDKRQKLVRATYFYTGAAPEEKVYVDGREALPQHAKVRDLVYCGRALVHQRVLWLPANRKLAVWLDGEARDLVFKRPPFPRHMVTPKMLRWHLGEDAGRVRQEVSDQHAPEPRTREGRRAQRAAASGRWQKKYHHAWVLMDRIHDAGDSGEILFRHLRAEQPQTNAWFVIEKGTADWNRLRAEGYGDRLVAHGSLQWRILMAHALHLISSHADTAITEPEAITEFTRPRWKFTFLQHGVIKDDLASWLNRKTIDTFVTSTRQEHASIAGDHTPYVFTTREVRLTGLPRFDRLLEVGRRFPADRRDLVLVAPTWRNGLLPPAETGTQRRSLDDSILDSDFVRQWTRFLSSPALEEAAERNGVRIGFLPHPNLQPLLPRMALPRHVQPLSYDGVDVQEYFARARVFVTDFSSVAFNAAYLDRPVVYFQFDEEDVLGGAHVGRRGYFDYRRDGFGPVETTLDAAVGAVAVALDRGPEAAPEYRQRVEATFPVRDGRCSERVVEAIRRSVRNRSEDPPEPVPARPGHVVAAAP